MSFAPKLLMFIVWVARWIKPALLWTSSKSLLMAGFLLKYVRVILTFYFILGFIPDAMVQFSRDISFSGVTLFIYNVTTPFLTAEHKIVESIATIDAGLIGFWGIAGAYVDIMASLVIFVYIFKYIVGFFAFTASNSSLKGLAPYIFAFIVVFLAEYSVLGQIAVADSGGDRMAAFTIDAVPFVGIGTLIWNFDVILRPFMGLIDWWSSDTDDPPPTTDESIADVVNIATNHTGEPQGGFVSGMFRFVCGATGLC